MHKIRYLFAVLFAIAFTSTVFGMTELPFSTEKFKEVETMDISGNGTINDPYIAKTYEQLKWAFSAGGYVKLGADISADAGIYTVADEVDLDLAGHTYTNGSSKNSAFYIMQSKTLNITDSGQNGAIVSNSSGISASISSNLNIHGGKIVTDGTAVFAGCYSEISLYDGTIESANTALYLNGAWFYQYGGYIKTTSESLNSSIAFDSYYDSGNSVSNDVRIYLFLYGGKIDKLYIPFKEANIYYVEIYDTTVYNYFGYQTKTDAETMFKGGYSEVCSKNLADAISAAISNSYKEVSVANTVSVHQKKTVIPYIEIPNDITPVLNSSLIYPKAASDVPYSFDSSWYDGTGQKLSSVYQNNSDHLGAYSFSAKGKAKAGSNYMFASKALYLPNVDNRLYTGGVTTFDENTAEYIVSFSMAPFVTVQPKDKANVTVGDTLTFTTAALEAKTFKWYLLDTDGNKVTWETAEEYGVISALNGSQNTDTLKIKILSTDANAFRVYCEIYGNYKTVNTNQAKISTKKPVILTQPTGIGGIYNISVKNAQSLEWCIVDENNTEYTWEQAKANGWGYPVDGSENTASLKLTSIGHGLEGKKVYCKVSGYGYNIDSYTVNIGSFIEIGAHLNIYDLQLPFPGVEFSTGGAYTDSNGYELESLKLVYGKDLTEVNDKYIDFDNGNQYLYHAVFKPKSNYCFTEDSISNKYNINGFIVNTNKQYKYTGTINRKLVDGKVSVLLVPYLDNSLYRNTKAMNVNTTQNSVSVRNYYEKSLAGMTELNTLGAPTYNYSLDGKNWYAFPEINGGSGPFGGLTPNTEYTVYFKNADTNYIFKTMSVKTLSVPGDVDENGKVEQADAALLLKHISTDTMAELSSRQKRVADVYTDGNVDMLDVIAILNMI